MSPKQRSFYHNCYCHWVTYLVCMYIYIYIYIVYINPTASLNSGRVRHMCISKLTIIGSDNGLSPGRCQAIIWTNAGILFIWPLGTIFSEMLIEIQMFLFEKMQLKMLSAKWRPFSLSLNVLTPCDELYMREVMVLYSRLLSQQWWQMVSIHLTHWGTIVNDSALRNWIKKTSECRLI